MTIIRQFQLNTKTGSHVPFTIPNNDDLNQTKVIDLRISLHDLWIEHIVWTRQYVVAAAANQPDR
ncbi:MAG: hypothetical protein M3288_04310 [Thermoproteota archaeon]|nr:hypothetical protein [Thermoproteota archaeon]